MPLIICTDADELEEHLKTFQSGIAANGIMPNGEATQGGITNAPVRFTASCVKAFQDLDLASATLESLCKRAVTLAEEIVVYHVFRDGNGRTSMYAIYLFMACCGYKFKLPPIVLHAYMFGEEQKGKVPAELATKIAPYMRSGVAELTLRSHLVSMATTFGTLEAARVKSVEYSAEIRKEDRNAKPSLLSQPSAVYVDSGRSAIDRYKARLDLLKDIDQKNLRRKELFDQTNLLRAKIAQEWSKPLPIPWEDIGRFITEHRRTHGTVLTYQEYLEKNF